MEYIKKSDIRISPTKLILFEQCPFKFKKQVIEKDKISSIWLDIGSIVHNLIEKFTEKESLEDTYIENYIEKKSIDYNNNDKLLIKSTITKMLRKNFYAIKNFIKNKEFYIEKWFETEFNEFKFVGKVDLIVKDKSKYIIVDYKTSKPNKKTGLHYKTDFTQWLMYALLIKRDNNLKKLNPVCLAWYLRTGFKEKVQFKDNDLNKIFIKIHCLLEKIEENIYYNNKSFGNKGFKPKRNKFCNWCDYKKICGK